MSGAVLDMSLDDIIKNNKQSASRGRGRAAGPGPARRLPNRSANRAAPYGAPKVPEGAWGNDMFAGRGGGGGRTSSTETGTKLYISNLDYGVSNEDIKELFGEVGDLKRYNVHYDRSGRSKGTADVVLSQREDALAAVKKYNNVQLDGKPMKVEIVGSNRAAPQSGQRRGGFGRSRGGGRGGGAGRDDGKVKGRGGKVSSEDLDADLEKYHTEAMQIN